MFALIKFSVYHLHQVFDRETKLKEGDEEKENSKEGESPNIINEKSPTEIEQAALRGEDKDKDNEPKAESAVHTLSIERDIEDTNNNNNNNNNNKEREGQRTTKEGREEEKGEREQQEDEKDSRSEISRRNPRYFY